MRKKYFLHVLYNQIKKGHIMRIEKISSIQNYNFAKSNIQKTNPINFRGDSFEKTSEKNSEEKYKDIIKYSVDWGWLNFDFPDSDFRAYFPRQGKLDILYKDEYGLRDVAESLCMYTDNDIKKFATIFHPLRFGINQKKSELAYKRLKPYIEEQRQRLYELMQIKERLEEKSTKFDIGKTENDTLKFIDDEINRISQKCQRAQSDYLKYQDYEVSDETYDEGVYY